MAGYSATPLARKLGITTGARIALVAAPAGFERSLDGLPERVTLRRQARGPLDVLVFFCTRRSDLEKRFARLANTIELGGGLWIAWPKKASGVATDLTENVVREIGLDAGLVDNKVCAVDETWSGLRFVYRVRDRG